MEKLWNLIEKILPLLAFYPGWARAIFLTTFGFVLLSVFLFISLYPSAKRLDNASIVEEPPSDVRISIEQTDNSITKLYADLGFGLSDLYTSSTSLRLHLLSYTEARPNIQQYTEDKIPQDLQADVQEVIVSLDKVRAALVAINQDSLATEAWSKARRVHKATALEGLKASLMLAGFSESESSISGSDIPALAQFLSLASQKLKAFTFAYPLSAVLATNSADIEAVGKAYDNASLRSLIFTGNLIFAFVAPAPGKKGETIIASWGSAILLDVYKSIPDAPVLREVVKSKYDRYAKYLDAHQFGLKSDRLVSADLTNAMNELEKRKDLLFLELPDYKTEPHS
jgi:hypothetical protein